MTDTTKTFSGESVDVPVDIGSRLELMVDDYLIDSLSGGARLVMHRPTPREVAIVMDKPWEGNSCGYITVFQDGDLCRMYYRGSQVTYSLEGMTEPHPSTACYAESRDGVNWSKPELGLFEFEGSKRNNIVWLDCEKDRNITHNFAPFKDTNPKCKAEEGYKALGGLSGEGGGLYALKSPDGTHWSLMSETPVITEGDFDSQNLAFWDAARGGYRSYHRKFRDGRDITTSTSQDFLQWTDPVFLEYTPSRVSELYTNQIMPYYRAPHLLLGFPTRYLDRGWSPSTEALPQPNYRRVRAATSPREGTAVTDGMFMSSRDGFHFHVWPESFLRPGLRTKYNWFYGDNYQSWGLVETKSDLDGAPKELSMYTTESYGNLGQKNWFRRCTLRVDGFVSVQAPMSGGELVTKPLVFQGSKLLLNFSTGAAGLLRVEIQDGQGKPFPDFALTDCEEIFGDDLGRAVPWKNAGALQDIVGKPVRLRFELHDADLYAFQFGA